MSERPAGPSSLVSETPPRRRALASPTWDEAPPGAPREALDMPQRHISLAAAAALAAVFVVAGCGSTTSSTSSLSPNAKWADSVCSALTTWGSSMKAAGATLQDGNLTADSVQAATSSVQSATTTLTTTLKGIGKPPTQAGDTTDSALGQLGSQLRAGIGSIQSAITNSPPLAAVATV